MTPCEVDENGYCERHQRRHTGNALKIALREGSVAEAYRREWDRQAGLPVAFVPREKRVALTLVPAEVEAERLAHCGPCDANVDGQCQDQLKVKPGKPASVYHGAKNPRAHCPRKFWAAVTKTKGNGGCLDKS